jgi:hypothetical protein
MVERHKGWTVSILILLLIVLGCERGAQREESFRVGKTYLIPERVRKGEKVELVFETISNSGNLELQIDWKRNGLPIDDVHSSELSSFYFQKGDTIVADVTVTGGDGMAKVFSLGPVVCVNSPPAVSTAEISILDSTTLSAQVEHEDIDGDSVTIIKKWYRNENPVHTGESFVTSLLQRGDTVVVEAIAYDGEAEGKSVRSAPVLIGNHPPSIVSTPPRVKGEQYVYQIGAEDPDGDQLTYNLKAGPDGMTIDPSGSLTWTRGVHAQPLYAVEIEVVDGYGGSAVQRFELNVEEKGRF